MFHSPRKPPPPSEEELAAAVEQELNSRIQWDAKLRLKVEQEMAAKLEQERRAQEEEQEKARKREEALQRQNEKSMALAKAMREKADSAAAVLEVQHQKLLQQQREAAAEKQAQAERERQEQERRQKAEQEAKEREEQKKQQELLAEKQRRASRLQEKVEAQKEADMQAEQRWMRHQVETGSRQIAKNKKGVYVSFPTGMDAEAHGTPLDPAIHKQLIEEFTGGSTGSQAPETTGKPKMQPRLSVVPPLPKRPDTEAKPSPPETSTVNRTGRPSSSEQGGVGGVRQRPLIFTPADAAVGIKYSSGGPALSPPAAAQEPKKFQSLLPEGGKDELDPEPQPASPPRAKVVAQVQEMYGNDAFAKPKNTALASTPSPANAPPAPIAEQEEQSQPKPTPLGGEEMLASIAANPSSAGELIYGNQDADSARASASGGPAVQASAELIYGDADGQDSGRPSASAVSSPAPGAAQGGSHGPMVELIYGDTESVQQQAKAAASPRAVVQPIYGDDDGGPAPAAGPETELVYGNAAGPAVKAVEQPVYGN